MPVGRRQQVNAMLYTLVTFVALFVIATILAVIFYVKVENYQKEAAQLQEQKNELVSTQQWSQRGSLVGAKQRSETYIGKLLSYLDETVSMIVGGPVEQTSAEAKLDVARSKFKETLTTLQSGGYVQTTDPNGEGFIWVVKELRDNLDNIKKSEQNLRGQLEELQIRFDNSVTQSLSKEETLLAEKEKYHQMVETIRSDYSEFETLMKQNAEEQVKSLISQLNKLQLQNSTLNQELMKKEAELRIAQDRMNKVQRQLSAVIPPPDANSPAYKPDGKILLVDSQSKIVHINLGREDKIYRGLTFSVYDEHAAIPKNGKSKAEIEVFKVGDTISAARIIKSEIRNPIIMGNKVINLIWDSNNVNYFVVAGDFDLDGDGTMDRQGPEKIKSLIRKWGGEVADKVSIDVDYAVLGQEPGQLTKPTFEEMSVDPLAMDKYQASVARNKRYHNVMEQAKALSVPIFNTERFLYFTGYKSLSRREDAF